MKKGLLALATALMLGSGISEAAESYQIRGQFTSDNWSDIDLTETNGKWVSDAFTPTQATGNFGVKKLQDGTQIEWWYVPSAQTLTVNNPLTLYVGENGTNPSFSCDVNKSYTLTLDPATKTISMAEAGAATYPESIYLIGYVNGKGFAANNGIQMTKTEDGVYTCDATIGDAGEGFAYFSFAEKLGSSESAWSEMGTRYGATEKDYLLTFTDKTATATLAGSENSFKVASYKSLKFTVDLKKKTMTAVEKDESEIIISYQIRGQFTNSNWSDIDLTETNGKWVSDAFTPTQATGNFGVKKLQDGVQIEWWYVPSAQTLTVDNPLTLCVGNNGTNPSFQCDVKKSYTLTLDPATKTISIAEAGAATYPESIYLIGNVNGKGFAANNGIQMTKTGDGVYTCDANIGDAGEGFAYFSFAEKLGSSESAWSEMGTRYGATEDGFILTFTDKTATATLVGSQNAFKVASNKKLTVTADLKNKTITAVDKSGTPVTPTVTYAVVGTMNDWSSENLINMKKTGDNVYTATFAELPANTEFKIAKVVDGKFDLTKDASYGPEFNGPTTDPVKVAVNINGEATNAYVCSNNFLIEKAVKNATITFTYVESTTRPSLVKVEGTVEDTPVTYPESIYLIGYVNGKDFKPNNGIQMTKTGEGVYTCDATIGDAMLSGFGYFAFAEKLGPDDTDTSWSKMGTRYGATANDFELQFTDKTATADIAKGEYSFKVAANKKLTVTVDLKDMTMTAVDKTETEVPTELTATIVFGDYSTYTPNYANETWTPDGNNGNEYVYVENTQFKSTNADVTVYCLKGDASTQPRLYRKINDESNTTLRVFKKSANGTTYSSVNVLVGEKHKINKIEVATKDNYVFTLPEGAPGEASTTSKVTTWTAPADGAINAVTLLNTSNKTNAIKTITVTYVISTGVESIADASEDAPVYYYNLQGVRVENPSNGIFIRVQGNKSQKVMF